jgi:hypothetical protein
MRLFVSWIVSVIPCFALTACSSPSKPALHDNRGSSTGSNSSTSGAAQSATGSAPSGSSAGAGGTGTIASGSAGGNPSGSGQLPATSDAGAASSGAAAQDVSCAALASDPCFTCCEAHHPAGSQIHQTAVDDCICGPPNGTGAVCQAQCANTDCNSNDDAGSSQPGDPCDLCTTQATDPGGKCETPVQTACQVNPDCIAYVACTDQCP